jgi:amino acid transporter
MTLDRGALSTIDAVAMAIAVLSPAAAMAYNTTGAALFGGASTPLAFLLAGIACLCLAFVIIGFSRRMVSAGYLYTYCSKVLGPSSGFLVGWLYFFGFFCFVPMNMAGVGGFGRELLRSQFGAKVPDWTWLLIFLVCMISAVVLNVVDVRINARTQLWLGLVTVIIVVAVDILITIAGGQSGHSLVPFTFSHTLRGGVSGILYACIFAVLCYVGFETGAVFGEETRNPRKAIPASVLATVLFSVVFFVWTTYSIAIGVGVSQEGAELWAKDPRVLTTLATRYGASWLGVLVDLSAIISGFALSFACIATAARTLFAMGRDQVLPQWFGKTHSRYMTPANSTICIGLLATITVGIAQIGSTAESDPFTIYYFLGGVGSLAITVIYGIACASGIVWLRRFERPARSPYFIAIPAIGLVVFALVVYGSIYPGELPPWPYRLVPYVVAVWVFFGLVTVWRLKKSAPERIARIGSIMGQS